MVEYSVVLKVFQMVESLAHLTDARMVAMKDELMVAKRALGKANVLE